MKNKLRVLLLILGCVLQIHAEQIFDMASLGIVPNGKNLSAKMEKAIAKIKKQAKEDSIVIVFHDCMLPISLVRSKNCTLSNLSIDFYKPEPTRNILRFIGITAGFFWNG